jgi:hypothetical protein
MSPEMDIYDEYDKHHPPRQTEDEDGSLSDRKV